ncbi:MAG: DICT sensory domain-containing protein [Cyanobacteria bacterium P01_A01_bin.17]
MIIATSVLQMLLDAQPQLRPQIYFKSSLTALSHAMEDQVLASTDDFPLVIACFQRERYYRQEAHRYLRIAQRSKQVYVLAAPDTEFKNASGPYESIAFEPEDGLSQEWHLVVVGQQYAISLLCRELPTVDDPKLSSMDQARRFEGIWTFDRQVTCQAAQLMLERISHYRPKLKSKIKQALAQLDGETDNGFNNIDPAPFADRLVTYLQAGQYRQQKAYRQIATQERKERLVNSMTTTIRRSLNSEQVLQAAVQELGTALNSHRCIIYQCQEQDEEAQVQYEFTGPKQVSLLSQAWSLQHNPWFQAVAERQERVYVEDVPSHLSKNKFLKAQMKQAQLRSLLMVPVLYQGHLLGMVELHHAEIYAWSESEISMVDAIASQVGVALIQSQSFTDLETLNQQLEGLERTRSNLIAITGHELRTPLSTIQVCLESLANEPDMPDELQQVMLSTALSDAERMRKLIQDFLTLSRLESGRINSNPEPLALQECIDLALSRVRTHPTETQTTIAVELPADLPLVKADGEWLVEVLAKLLDNARKFTPAEGQITLAAEPLTAQMLEVSVTDTGRGIEADRLETVFDRFYQEEGALRRTTGGTGLGLAICRQIVQNLGGEIRAASPGKDLGSTFYFTLPIALGSPSSETHRRR